MTRKTITRLVGYGILIFVIGFFGGKYWINYIQWLIPVGTLMTFTGVFFFFKTTNLTDEFTKKGNDDYLTYFWDVIVLKLWTLIFVLWMIPMNITLMTQAKL